MSPIFSFDNVANGSTPKINVSQGTLPGFIDPQQPPTKKSPWRQIRDVPYGHSATLIVPDELGQAVWQKLKPEIKSLRYDKVILKLEDILFGDMFTEYIKRGNVLMLSEGRPGVDDVFSLCEGTLRLELCKETYERAGLQGKPVASGGRKHVKARFLVEIDLRQPSMLHGKKGFERIVWAAKNVLNRSLVWLFCDLSKDQKSERPIAQHHPTTVECAAEVTLLKDVLIPTLISSSSDTSPSPQPDIEDEETYYEIAEWLDLVSLESPRIMGNDYVDPYISRYTVPSKPDSTLIEQDLRILRWTGLIPSIWIIQLLIEIVKQSRTTNSSSWYALNVTSHRTKTVGHFNGYSLLVLPPHKQPPSTVSENGTKRKRDDSPESGVEQANAGTGTAGVDPTVEDQSNKVTTQKSASQSQSQEDGKRGQEAFTCFQYVDSGPS